MEKIKNISQIPFFFFVIKKKKNNLQKKERKNLNVSKVHFQF